MVLRDRGASVVPLVQGLDAPDEFCCVFALVPLGFLRLLVQAGPVLNTSFVLVGPSVLVGPADFSLNPMWIQCETDANPL